MCNEPTEPTETEPTPGPEPCRCRNKVVVVVGRGARLRVATRGELAAERRAKLDRTILRFAAGYGCGLTGCPSGRGGPP